MNGLTWLVQFNPFGRLTVTCHYPQEETLVFHRKGGRRFSLLSRPGQVFEVLALDIKPALPGLNRFISDGAIAGAAAAAFRGRDVLKGAVIGHWLEQKRQPSGRSHELCLILADVDSGEELTLGLSLLPEDCKTVYQYFVG